MSNGARGGTRTLLCHCVPSSAIVRHKVHVRGTIGAAARRPACVTACHRVPSQSRTRSGNRRSTDGFESVSTESADRRLRAHDQPARTLWRRPRFPRAEPTGQAHRERQMVQDVGTAPPHRRHGGEPRPRQLSRLYRWPWPASGRWRTARPSKKAETPAARTPSPSRTPCTK